MFPFSIKQIWSESIQKAASSTTAMSVEYREFLLWLEEHCDWQVGEDVVELMWQSWSERARQEQCWIANRLKETQE